MNYLTTVEYILEDVLLIDTLRCMVTSHAVIGRTNTSCGQKDRQPAALARKTHVERKMGNPDEGERDSGLKVNAVPG
jgi:hypothetical protein